MLNNCKSFNKYLFSFSSDDPMLVIHPYPARLVVAAGEEFSLNCTATGFPVPSIAWYLNNSEVSPGNGVTIMSSKNTYIVFSRILISRAGLNHTGGYHCQANNTSPAGVMQEDMSNLTLVQFTCKLLLKMSHRLYKFPNMRI